MTNSGTDASVICENLNKELREFNTPILKRIQDPEKKGGGQWKDELTSMQAKIRMAEEVRVTVSTSKL